MPSSFLGIYRAAYAYSPQGDGELEISEGDLLYILEKSTEDDWWKAKKRIVNSTEPEPVGLIPNNYVEEAQPISQVKAAYDYERQTNEELSFTEDSILDVYDYSDPDWTLVGFEGEYGFAPANYLEEQGDGEMVETPPSPPPPQQVQQHSTRPQIVRQPSEDSTDYSQPSAAAAVVAVLQQNQQRQVHYQEPASPVATTTRPAAYSQPAHAPQKRVNFTPEASDEEDEDEVRPQLPTRPRSIPGSISSPTSPPTDFSQIDIVGVHRYSVNEVVGKKKLPATLEIGNGHITLIPHQKNTSATTWDIENLSTYSADGKRVGLDLEVPHRSLDLHAGSKEVAEEIVSDLADLRGAIKAVGLREVMVAATSGGKKLGKILYNFEAQGDDEVTVRAGDEVVILDDSKSDEWWMVRRTSNGKEGVVPSSYIDIKETASPPLTPAAVQNEIASRAAAKAGESSYSRDREDSVGPGVRLPKRESSLASKSENDRKPKSDQKSASRSRPDPNKVRTWTDRSSTFKVDAQFLNCRDGVIHLHKTNGVKIAVPVIKMSRGDLEYVEKVTGMSLDEDKPLSDIRGRNQDQGRSTPTSSKPAEPRTGISIDKSAARGGSSKDDYDWFDFFLGCNVDVNACQRYAIAFQRDNMDESILPDVTPPVLQNLGLKQGDILKVMKFLDNKYGRNKSRAKGDGEDEEGKQGGLFAGPGGTLRNNTRKGRPAPAIQTGDTVDAKVFEQNGDSPIQPPRKTAETSSAPDKTGFEDDAWAPKPGKNTNENVPSSSRDSAQVPRETQSTQSSQLSGALADLSLLTPALEPTVVHKPAPQVSEQPQSQQSQQQQQQQFQPPANILSAPLSGAPPQFFPQNTVQNTQSAPQYVQYQQTGFQQAPLQPQFTAIPPQLSALQPQATAQPFGTLSRQRPAAPQIAQGTGLLAPPPPVRPLSAPGQNLAQNGYVPTPLQPTATGIPGGNYGIVQQPPPGGQLNLNDLQRLNYQQQIASQQTGFPQASLNNQQQQPQFQNNGYNQQGFQPQQTGFPTQGLGFQQTGYQPQQQQQPIINQPTGYNPLPPPFIPTVNLDLPPALIPQKVNNNTNSNNGNLGISALKPQPTGPAPPVKFGLTAAKLQPTPTGIRKANLRAATPQNPFGF